MKTETRSTERTLLDLVWEDPDLLSWWTRFQITAPAIADRLNEVRLVTDETAAAADGITTWPQAGAGYGDGWCCFEAAPRSGAFLCAGMGAAYQLKLPLAQSLADLAHLARESRSTALADFTHSAAVACGSWNVEEVERRLEMPLGKAYFQAGTVPLWVKDPHAAWETGEHQPEDPAEFLRREPTDFFLACLDGVLHRDTFWTHYSRLLFGPVPSLE